jgi:hypothetical protein
MSDARISNAAGVNVPSRCSGHCCHCQCITVAAAAAFRIAGSVEGEGLVRKARSVSCLGLHHPVGLLGTNVDRVEG